jgi:hypothetical protein
MSADAGHTLRVVVTGSGAGGDATATSPQTAVVQPLTAAANVDPCAGSSGRTVAVTSVALPNRLLVDSWTFSPSLVTRSTQSVAMRVHVRDACGRSVGGAQIWTTAIPYNQTNVATATTGSDGWATVTLGLLPGFPARPGRQEILATLVRATKPSDSVVAGVSTRRVLRLNVNLRR